MTNTDGSNDSIEMTDFGATFLFAYVRRMSKGQIKSAFHPLIWLLASPPEAIFKPNTGEEDQDKLVEAAGDGMWFEKAEDLAIILEGDQDTIKQLSASYMETYERVKQIEASTKIKSPPWDDLVAIRPSHPRPLEPDTAEEYEEMVLSQAQAVASGDVEKAHAITESLFMSVTGKRLALLGALRETTDEASQEEMNKELYKANSLMFQYGHEYAIFCFRDKENLEEMKKEARDFLNSPEGKKGLDKRKT